MKKNKKVRTLMTMILTIDIIFCQSTPSNLMDKETLQQENNNNFSTTISDSTFTKMQMNFLVNEFKKQLNYNTTSKVNVSIGETINMWMSGEEGYVPGIVFHPFYNPKFNGDFDKDGNKEIIFIIDETRGGTASWQIIYCLKEKKDASFKLIRLNYPCPCSKPFDCQDSQKPELINSINNNLIIKIGCLGEDDAQCCPSLYYEVTYKYENDSLIQISKRKINE